MYAYIDESGNTGFDLFDPAQPYFLNVAMSSPVDFDEVFRERVERIAQRAGVEYLHASEMGVDGVEAIARSLIELVKFSQVRFYFAAVDKADVAAMKFFDAIFDPGENPAAPRHSYIMRSLKFVLLFEFLHILEEQDIRLFWEAMTGTPSLESESKAVLVIDNAMQGVRNLRDDRSLSHRPVGELTNTGVGAMRLNRARPIQFHRPLVGPRKGRLPLLVPWGLGPAPRGLATAP